MTPAYLPISVKRQLSALFFSDELLGWTLNLISDFPKPKRDVFSASIPKSLVVVVLKIWLKTHENVNENCSQSPARDFVVGHGIGFEKSW